MFLYFFVSAVLFSVLLFISFLVSTLEKPHEDEAILTLFKMYIHRTNRRVRQKMLFHMEVQFQYPSGFNPSDVL